MFYKWTFFTILSGCFVGCSATPVGSSRDSGQVILGDTRSDESLTRVLGEPQDREGEGLFLGAGMSGESPLDKLDFGDKKDYHFPSFGKEAESERFSEPLEGRKGFQVLASSPPSQDYQSVVTTPYFIEQIGEQRTSFGLSYIRDSFEYQDSRGVFNRIFEDSDSAGIYGILMMNWSSYFYKTRFVQPYWLINAGFGFNRGNASFVDGEESDAVFSLWTLPLDFGLGLEVPLGNWAKFGAAAGPSGMGLIQNRSDVDSSEGAKSRRQGSYGYFYELHFKLNLARIFTSSGYELFVNQNVSSYYLTLKMRAHEYEKFRQEDFSVSGKSLGVGLTFEFL